jgi:peptidoglycan-N-acetylglucosamine deacetylase
MHACWFQKPVYKIARNIFFASMLMCGVLIIVFPWFWPCIIILLICWLTFIVFSSFFIHSGVYIETTCSVSGANGKVAITFDDGPDKFTTGILDLLAQQNAKGSFFLIGDKVSKNIEVVKRINIEHHTIGNHSMLHKYFFPLIPVRKIEESIATTQMEIKKITGTEPVYFRPPFGVTNPLIAKALRKFNLIVVGWSVRSFDTISKNPDKILNRILKKVKPGSIILLHDTSESVIPILKGLLDYCKQTDLRPVTLDDLLNNN